MNIKKIIALVLVAVFALSVCSSCVTDAAEIKVMLKITAGDDNIFNKEIGVSDPEGDGATVIEVLKEAAAQYELQLTFDASEKSLKDVKNYKECSIDEIPYYWNYTIDGVTPEAGRAGDNYVADGGAIVYTFCYSEPILDKNGNPTSKANEYPYKSEMELFGEGEEEETEEETVEEEAAE